MTTLIVGAGWSGLAAAVKLIQQGEDVILFESAKQIGGRARNVQWQSQFVDNGQHLLIGGYVRTLALLKKLGAEESALFKRYPLNISIFDKHFPPLHFVDAGNRLPWPLSLLLSLWKHNGFDVVKELSQLVLSAKRQCSKPDRSVLDWLHQQKQSPRLITQLWEPLCLAMLNTPIKSASTHVFAHVLLETFKNKQQGDFLIPTVPLGDTLPVFAERYIKQHYSDIKTQTRVAEIIIENDRVKGLVTQHGDTYLSNKIILAGSPQTNYTLLANKVTLIEPASYPIVTVYLQCKNTLSLKVPMLGLSSHISQWVFDRGDGLLAVVISGPGSHESFSNSLLIEKVIEELSNIQLLSKADVIKHLVIREKRATFRCDVNIQQRRPESETAIKGLVLAGDMVANPYPATLEGAVINGEKAAELIMQINRVS
ncbi:hypothetical protein LCGC14_0612510 [marine sediment metagenome]|uniref:Amine oxidase domain-containing protein n=1 Tax=marine sediment metagenome TaxID=412755 RepID=A0A0F9RC16_9ZZZZ